MLAEKNFILGCAQFSDKYGLFSGDFGISISEKHKIIETARTRGIKFLDTAYGYGNSEEILGNIGVSDFAIITKLPLELETRQKNEQFTECWFVKTIEKLRVDRLHAVLFHRTSQLKSIAGSQVYEDLLKLKHDKKIHKIGISIYHPQELDFVLKNYNFDIVQAPINVFDNRLKLSGWANELAHKNIEIHARSVFLQGLLLNSNELLPDYFSRWSDLFDEYERYIINKNFTRMEYALSTVFQRQYVSSILVGVQSSLELTEVLDTQIKACVLEEKFNVSDLDLIIPSKWVVE